MQSMTPGDLDDVQELQNHPGWVLVRRRVLDAIGELQELLENVSDEAATNLRRGQIAGLRTALAIPGILENEAKTSHAINRERTTH